MLSERVPVLLTPEQKRRLERIAKRDGVSVGAVVRAAIDAHTGASTRSRREALDDLCATEAPVDDWSVMRAEILAGSLGERLEPGEMRRRMSA